MEELKDACFQGRTMFEYLCCSECEQVVVSMTGRINTGAPPHTGSADYVQ